MHEVRRNKNKCLFPVPARVRFFETVTRSAGGSRVSRVSYFQLYCIKVSCMCIAQQNKLPPLVKQPAAHNEETLISGI